MKKTLLTAQITVTCETINTLCFCPIFNSYYITFDVTLLLYWVLPENIHTPPRHRGNFCCPEGNRENIVSDMVSVRYLRGDGEFVGMDISWNDPLLLIKGFSYFVQLKVCIENNLPNHRLCSKKFLPNPSYPRRMAYPTYFSSVPTPGINNEHSLMSLFFYFFFSSSSSLLFCRC